MATNITFNSFNLQDSTYLTNNIVHRHLAEEKVDTKPTPRRGSFTVVDAYYVQKIIQVTGWVKAASEETLRVAIDTLKKNLRGVEKDLDIDYGDGTIRYKATLESLDVPEEHYHITQIPFTILFLVAPWGTSITQVTQSYTINSTPDSNSLNFGGSFGPFPTIKMTINSKSSMTVLKFKNTTKDNETSSITITRTFTASEVLTINCEDQIIDVDGTNVDFTGVLPEFSSDTNEFQVDVTDGGAFNITLLISYYPTFL